MDLAGRAVATTLFAVKLTLLADAACSTDPVASSPNAKLSGFPDLGGATLMVRVSATNTTGMYRVSGSDSSGALTSEVPASILVAGDRYVLANTPSTINAGQWAQEWDAVQNTFLLSYATADATQLTRLRWSNFNQSLIQIPNPTSGAKISNFIFTGAAWGIYIYGAGTQVLGNIFTSIYYGVLHRSLSPTQPMNGLLIKNNLFVATQASGAIGSAGSVNDVVITQNEIGFSAGDGIDFGAGEINRVEASKNYIHHLNQQFVHTDGFQLFAATTEVSRGVGSIRPDNIKFDKNFVWISGQHFGAAIENNGTQVTNIVFMNSAATMILPNMLTTINNPFLAAGNSFLLTNLGPWKNV